MAFEILFIHNRNAMWQSRMDILLYFDLTEYLSYPEQIELKVATSGQIVY